MHELHDELARDVDDADGKEEGAAGVDPEPAAVAARGPARAGCASFSFSCFARRIAQPTACARSAAVRRASRRAVRACKLVPGLLRTCAATHARHAVHATWRQMRSEQAAAGAHQMTAPPSATPNDCTRSPMTCSTAPRMLWFFASARRSCAGSCALVDTMGAERARLPAMLASGAASAPCGSATACSAPPHAEARAADSAPCAWPPQPSP